MERNIEMHWAPMKLNNYTLTLFLHIYTIYLFGMALWKSIKTENILLLVIMQYVKHFYNYIQLYNIAILITITDLYGVKKQNIIIETQEILLS